MRSRDNAICFLCLLIAVAMLIAARMQLDYIDSQRRKMKLIRDVKFEDTPLSPVLATIAMGAFRGLVVDVLWMRAEKLKEEGQFFDARQLAEWITTLQPRFGEVWVFQAWNMAYNISVTMPETQPHLRWQWVKNGYELLRDKGIPSNPMDIQLYHELGRIFQHKIGSVSDDAHKYYKLQMAMELGPLLDAADNEYFDNLVEAGQWLWGSEGGRPDFTEIWGRIAAEPNFAPLVEGLRSADKAFSYNAEFISNYLTLRQDARKYAPDAAKVIDAFRKNPELKRFDILAKAFYLRQIWKLEPTLMRRLNQTYGPIDWNDPNTHLPLDWRHPDSHAIFWAVKGLEIASAQGDKEISGPETNTDRIVAHSLQNLFRNGKLFLHATPISVPSDDTSKPPQIRIMREVYLRPDLRIFESYNNAIVKIIEKYRVAEDTDAVVSIGNGHRNMLKNALLSFYQSGHKKYAQKILDMLRDYYPLPEFNVPLIDYARARMFEELENIGLTDAKEQIIALFKESYYLYAIRDDNAAYGREELAKQIHNHYTAEYDDENRINLPELNMMKYFAVEDFLADQQFSPYLKNRFRARVEIERPDFFEQLQKMRQQRINQQQTQQP